MDDVNPLQSPETEAVGVGAGFQYETIFAVRGALSHEHLNGRVNTTYSSETDLTVAVCKLS